MMNLFLAPALLRLTRLLPLRGAGLVALLLAALLAGVGPAAAQSAQAAPSRVLLSTSMGDIVLELDAAKSPQTVDNFLRYVRDGHYDGTVFHRVISGFMIQGGGFDAQMQQKPTRAPIALESRNGLSNRRGTVAMARTQVPDSATAQFFINVADNTNLDAARSPDGQGYAVFGRVIAGLDVVDRIKAVATGSRGMHRDVPLQPVLIKKATLQEK